MYAIEARCTIKEQSTSSSFEPAQFSLATLLLNMTEYNGMLYSIIAGFNLVWEFIQVCEVSEPLHPFYLKTWDILANWPRVWYEHTYFIITW